MNNVLVFRTSVIKRNDISLLRPMLDKLVKRSGRWNFDLEDCDNVLRIESGNLHPARVISTLTDKGFHCEELQ